MTAPTHREQVIAGLEELAQFLRDHPDLPVRTYTGAHMLVHARHEGGATTDSEGVAFVDRVAALLGVEPQDSGHYTAERVFSGGVTYEASHIPAEWSEQYYARQSYQNNVQVTAGAS